MWTTLVPSRGDYGCGLYVYTIGWYLQLFHTASATFPKLLSSQWCWIHIIWSGSGGRSTNCFLSFSITMLKKGRHASGKMTYAAPAENPWVTGIQAEIKLYNHAGHGPDMGPDPGNWTVRILKILLMVKNTVPLQKRLFWHHFRLNWSYYT